MSNTSIEHTLAKISDIDFHDDPTGAVSAAIGFKYEWFDESVNSGTDALIVNLLHSQITDTILESLYNSVIANRELQSQLSIIALGGYGRREYGLHCDIDLLFLHDGMDQSYASSVAEKILYPFWNCGVEIGGATRTLDDCKKVISEDVKALTAMIDLRRVCGCDILTSTLLSMIKQHFSSEESKRRFFSEKLLERDTRLERYGDTIYLLQPNIKEGEGGLRDYHTLDWVLHALSFDESREESFRRCLPSDEARYEIIESVRFLWRIRHHLHLIKNKRNDRLSEHLQEEIAERIISNESEGSSHAEQLMSSYYKSASSIHLQCDRALERLRRTVFPTSIIKRIFLKRKLRNGIYVTEHRTLSMDLNISEEHLDILKGFEIAKNRSIPIDPITKDDIAHMPDVAESVLCSKSAQIIWHNILSSYKSIDRTFRDMSECNYLTKWFPEMKPMLDHVQHDGFHVYTTGEHSIRAIEAIAKLHASAGKIDSTIKTAFQRVKKPHILILGTLLHDVGKGRGGGHSIKGADLAYHIVKRLGYDEDDAMEVSFLVKHHLTMAKIAFKRDVDDVDLLNRFAQTFTSGEMLSILYILTYADIKAISPNMWNDWKASLLSELYINTLQSIDEGGISDEQRRNEISNKRKEIIRKLGGTQTDDELDKHLHSLPDRYVYNNSADTIIAHMIMAKEIATKPLSTMSKIIYDKGCTEFSVVTKDKPGLFATMTGILAAAGANINDAQLYTSADGVAMDIFHITDSSDKPFEDPAKWEHIRREMTEAIAGQKDIATIFESRFSRSIFNKSVRKNKVEVSIDNDISENQTVVEIHADDRLGLLYKVAFTFHNLKLTIDRARITTHVDRVIDVFYIRDRSGNKIMDSEVLNRIKSRMTEELGS